MSLHLHLLDVIDRGLSGNAYEEGEIALDVIGYLDNVGTRRSPMVALAVGWLLMGDMVLIALDVVEGWDDGSKREGLEKRLRLQLFMR